MAHPFRIALAEGERDHAAVGAAGNRPQRFQAQVIEQADQDFRLVVAGNVGERHALFGPGGLGAAAEKIEAEDAEAVGIQRPLGADDLRPPALPGIFSQAHAAMRRNAAEGAYHRSIRGTCDTPGDPHAGELAAVVQGDLAWHLEDAFADHQVAHVRGRHRRYAPGNRLDFGVHV